MINTTSHFGTLRYPLIMHTILLKVGSHDPISIQLTLKTFVCVMEFVSVYTIQFCIQLFRDELEKL